MTSGFNVRELCIYELLHEVIDSGSLNVAMEGIWLVVVLSPVPIISSVMNTIVCPCVTHAMVDRTVQWKMMKITAWIDNAQEYLNVKSQVLHVVYIIMMYKMVK